jgi:multidrug efflux pump subunit AcrB
MYEQKLEEYTMIFLSRFSLANRSLIALASVAVILAGLVVLPLLKQDELPPITYPAIELITAYPGATPEQVEQDVTTPLEENIRGLQQVQQVTSQSSEGLSLITVLYNDGTDLDTAQQKLAAQVRQVQPALPTNVTPASQIFNPADLPILLLTVTSTEDVQTLAPALNQYVLPTLQGVKTAPGRPHPGRHLRVTTTPGATQGGVGKRVKRASHQEISMVHTMETLPWRGYNKANPS